MLQMFRRRLPAKRKAPNPKLQGSPKGTNRKERKERKGKRIRKAVFAVKGSRVSAVPSSGWRRELGIWGFPGVWGLELGIWGLKLGALPLVGTAIPPCPPATKSGRRGVGSPSRVVAIVRSVKPSAFLSPKKHRQYQTGVSRPVAGFLSIRGLQARVFPA